MPGVCIIGGWAVYPLVMMADCATWPPGTAGGGG